MVSKAIIIIIRWCGLESVTDRLYSCYRADSDVKWIKPNVLQTSVLFVALHIVDRLLNYEQYEQDAWTHTVCI